ncbi:hypothetical protein ACFE04_000655 [Oxalis oulophora]
MEPAVGKPGFLRNILVKALFFGLLIIIVRFAYVVTITGENCNVGNFCFFSLPENINSAIIGTGTFNKAVAVRSTSSVTPTRSKDWIKSVQFHSSVFQDLIAEGYLRPDSKSLCLETVAGSEVFALKEIGVEDAIGISRKASKPLVVSYVNKEKNLMPFGNNTFDFMFSGRAGLDALSKPLDLVTEIERTMKPKGYLIVHVKAKDTYSFHSFLDLFDSFDFIKSRSMDGFDSSLPGIKEIVMQKREGSNSGSIRIRNVVNNGKKCSIPSHKRELVQKAEPLIKQEPLKPWLTLKKNVKSVKYLPAMVDISFRSRYVYVDVGARSYGSSIASWFKKQYPKQNKTFDIYAIEADKHFHEDYKLKKGVNLLPYAAWVKNETLMFEINGDPGKQVVDKGRGMGRIKPADLKFAGDGSVEKIQGFDFAQWMKNSVTEKDYVVMKMDVEGTEFDLIPRLFQTGAICLIDELFLECHYNRWQRCCPGQRSTKYEKTYDQCLELFTTLRESGVLVHQWW